jgi:hypothetical protein
MKHTLAFFTALLLVPLAALNAAEPAKPNILYILAEQPEKVKELRAQLDAVMKTAVAPVQDTTSKHKKQK